MKNNLFYRKKLKVSEANLKTNVEDLKEEKKESDSKSEDLNKKLNEIEKVKSDFEDEK